MNTTEIKAKLFDLDMQAKQIAQMHEQLMQTLVQQIRVEQTKHIEDLKKAEEMKVKRARPKPIEAKSIPAQEKVQEQ